MRLLFDARARQVEHNTGGVFCHHSRENRIAHETRSARRVDTPQRKGKEMSNVSSTEAAKAVVRRNTDEVQGEGRFDVFDELFADDFTDHTPQPNTTPDKTGVRKLYAYIRDAFPDFHAEIHWQLADGDRVTTYKTYRGTHEGPFLGVAPTHRKIYFEAVDVMRVQHGKITDHWGVSNLLSLMQQIGGWTQPAEELRGVDDSTFSAVHAR